jgi:hypothetical protein
VPATDAPIPGETFLNQPNLFGSPRFREFSRIDVGNAVAAIEASVALDYLLNHGLFTVIDANNNKLITAQEIQTFVDQAATIGLPEAGALARFLGGTARPPGERPILDPADDQVTAFTTAASAQTGLTALFEQPDQLDVLQRRYNFLDFAIDGQLNGSISIDQLVVLAHNLLPPPDSFVITDRPRASANNYLLEAHAGRNISDLQHTLPRYAFAPAGAVRRFRALSPARFGVGRGIDPALSSPLFTLFDPQQPRRRGAVKQAIKPAVDAGSTTPTSTVESSSPATATTPEATAAAATRETPASTLAGTTGSSGADIVEALKRLANVPANASAAQAPADPGQAPTDHA